MMERAGRIDSVATVSEVEVMIGMTTLSGLRPRLKEKKATTRAKAEMTRKLERFEIRAAPTRNGRLAPGEAGFTIKYATVPKTTCIRAATASTWSIGPTPPLTSSLKLLIAEGKARRGY